MDKDLKKLINAAEAQGFTVEPSRKGHPMFSINGRVVATSSSTASDPRSVKNLIAVLRRAGFQWPPQR